MSNALEKDRLGTYASVNEVFGGDGAITSLYLAWTEGGQVKSGYVPLLPESASLLGLMLLDSAWRTRNHAEVSKQVPKGDEAI